MDIYIITFIIEMLLGVILLRFASEKTSNRMKIIYLTITTFILGILGGYRSSLVGCDTESYYDSFLLTPDNVENIFDNTQHIETGFSVLCTFVKICGGDFTHLLLICSFFIVGSFSVFVYRHSLNVLLSIFILLCFPYYYSSFDIIRHFVATSFLLLAFKYILEGNFLKYALYILVGSIFHNTGILYLLLYPILRSGWSRRNCVIILIATAFFMTYASFFANFIVAETGRFDTVADEWVGEYSGGILTCVMYFVILIIAYYARNNRLEMTMENDIYIICIFLLFIFSLIFIKARIAVRYIMTFSGLMAVAIPYLLDSVSAQKKRFNKILLISFICIGLLYHAFMLVTNWQNVVPYIPSLVYPYL